MRWPSVRCVLQPLLLLMPVVTGTGLSMRPRAKWLPLLLLLRRRLARCRWTGQARPRHHAYGLSTYTTIGPCLFGRGGWIRPLLPQTGRLHLATLRRPALSRGQGLLWGGRAVTSLSRQGCERKVRTTRMAISSICLGSFCSGFLGFQSPIGMWRTCAPFVCKRWVWGRKWFACRVYTCFTLRRSRCGCLIMRLALRT